jgi:hypothetical protein
VPLYQTQKARAFERHLASITMMEKSNLYNL